MTHPDHPTDTPSRSVQGRHAVERGEPMLASPVVVSPPGAAIECKRIPFTKAGKAAMAGALQTPEQRIADLECELAAAKEEAKLIWLLCEDEKREQEKVYRMLNDARREAEQAGRDRDAARMLDDQHVRQLRWIIGYIESHGGVVPHPIPMASDEASWSEDEEE